MRRAEPGLALAVLAGGQSRRMGRPKSLLPVAGVTLVEWLAARLAPEFDQLLVCAPPELVPAGLHAHLCPDLHPGAGPLAGIEAALAASRTELVFALACDQPLASVALARLLAGRAPGLEAVLPRVGGLLLPTAAVYRRTLAARLGAELEAGSRAAHEAMGRVRLGIVEEPERAAAGLLPELEANLNTPADHERFLRRLGDRPRP